MRSLTPMAATAFAGFNSKCLIHTPPDAAVRTGCATQGLGLRLRPDVDQFRTFRMGTHSMVVVSSQSTA